MLFICKNRETLQGTLFPRQILKNEYNRFINLKGNIFMKYVMVETEMVMEETCERVKTYGIILWDAEKEIFRVPDVSPNKEHVNNLVRLLNQKKASTLHFREIIEDFLGNEEFFQKSLKNM